MRWGLRRGFALITSLLFIAMLTAMMTALFTTVRTKLFQSKTYHDQVAALYLAELAVADAMGELGNDPAWTAGFNNKSLPGVEGSYSVTFNTTGPPYSNLESVNNSDGLHDESYRGPVSINPGQCLLVATGSVGRASRTVEAVVDLGGGLLPVGSPLVVDGRIVMSGQVKVEGVQSLSYPSAQAVNMHSNLTDAHPNLVDIDDTNCLIDGTVSVSSSDPGSVNLGSYTPSGGPPQLGAPQRTLPPIDISTRVASKSGASPVPGSVPPSLFPSVSGSPTAAFLDVTNLTHSGGPEYYSGGSLTVGDLKLDGASLYINGDLTVNGAIEGAGSVWVTGNTSFRGSSNITTSTPDRVALYSQGNVELLGFDGTALIQQYTASGPNAADIDDSWTTINDSINYIRANIGGLTQASDIGPNHGFDDLGTGTLVQRKSRANIGSGFNGNLDPSGFGAAGTLVYRDPGRVSGGHHQLNTSAGNRFLFNRASSPGRDFLIRRLFHLYQINYGAGYGTSIEIEAYNQAKNGRLVFGGVDAVNDNFYYQGLPLVKAYYNNYDLDLAGSSYFQGQIYTNGYFHSQNDVTVIGAVVTDVPAGARAGVDMTDSAPDPGDVVLENGSKILFVEDFFQARPRRSTGGSPGVKIRVWCQR